MAKLYNYKTGKLEEVGEAEASSLVLQGSHSPLKGDVLNVVSPQGTYGTIPAEKAKDYFQEGFRYEGRVEREERRLESQYGAGGGATTDALAFSEGVGRGLSFGASDHLLKAAGVSAEGLRERKNRNPYMATSGEVGAILASTLLSGGATAAASGAVKGGKIAAALTKSGKIVGSAPAKLAGMGQSIEKTAAGAKLLRSLASKGVAGKAAAKAASMGAGSAVEGAFYGAGKLVSEDALGETELNAENLAAYMGTGFLLGGASAAALGTTAQLVKSGVVDTGLGSAVSRYGKKKLESVSDIKGWLKSASKNQALKAGLGNRKKAYDDLNKYDAIDRAGDYLQDIIKKEKVMTPDDIIPFIQKDRERIGQEIGELVTGLDDLRGVVDDAELPSMFDIAQRVDDEVLKPLTAQGDNPATRSAVREVKNYVDYYLDRASKDNVLSFSDAQVLRESIRNAGSHVDPQTLKGARLAIKKILNEEAEAKSEVLIKKYSSKFSDSMQQGYKELKKKYSVVKSLDDFVSKNVVSGQANRGMSLTDYGSVGIGAAMGNGILPSGIMGATLGAANKFIIRDRGNAMLSILADKVSGMSGIEAISNTVGRTVSGGVKTAMKALVVPQRLTPLAVKTVDPLRRKSKKPRSYEVLEKTNYGSRRGKSDDRYEAYKKRFDELTELVSDPRKMTDTLHERTGRIASVAPKIAQSLNMATVRAAQYLHEKAPKPSEDFNQFSRAKDLWRPSDSALSKWERIVRAVESPTSVLDDLAERRLSADAVQAVRDVYPQLYAQMMKSFIREIENSKEPLPKESRFQISLFTGEGLPSPIPLATPKSEEQAEQQESQKPLNVRVGALDSIQGDKSNITEMQRLATS